jgi:adenylyltransferase/sulfurtransferase
MLTDKYDRQIRLNHFGLEAQHKLANAKVLVVGAGGLGCPALLYLAASGVGTLGVADYDVIERSNLHRQILFGEADLGLMKAEVAVKKLKVLHPHMNFICINERMHPKNVLSYFSDFDLILDCTDNFETRYLINDACVLLNKPWVYGSLYEYEGQVSVFNHTDESGVKANYRHIFPDPPANDEIQTCNEAGVLGVLAGVIGTLMAAEVIKVIAQTGRSLSNLLLSLNLRTNEQQVIRILKENALEMQQNIPQSVQQLETMDYSMICRKENNPAEVDYFQILSWLEEFNTQVIDIREGYEQPKITSIPVKEISVSELDVHLLAETTSKRVILICRTGRRSNQAAARIRQLHPELTIYSLEGGIFQWPQLINATYEFNESSKA